MVAYNVFPFVVTISHFAFKGEQTSRLEVNDFALSGGYFCNTTFKGVSQFEFEGLVTYSKRR